LSSRLSAMLFASTDAVFATKLKSRCLVAQDADSERHRFFVASSCLRDENEIQLIEYNEEMMDSVTCVHVFQHPKEVFDIAPSPRDATLLITCASDGEVVLWRAPLAGDATDADDDRAAAAQPSALEAVATVAPGREPCRVLWKPQENVPSEQVGTMGRGISIWDVAGGSLQESCTLETAGAASSGAWDPHHGNIISATHDCSASGWDLRSGKRAFVIEEAHRYAARDIDYNPNKPQFVATCGDDRLIKCWDLRSLAVPAMQLAGHSHWVWTCKYNRFHDQLLLSGGTDSLVNLWRCSSVSSAPLLDLDGDSAKGSDTDDCKVRTFDVHEESVYSVAWSACDAWVFASLDYSGRVAINHVPSTEKYKILL